MGAFPMASFAPCTETRYLNLENLEPGKKFAGGNRNSGLWDLNFSSWNPESH